jgi:hypothetical protein
MFCVFIRIDAFFISYPKEGTVSLCSTNFISYLFFVEEQLFIYSSSFYFFNGSSIDVVLNNLAFFLTFSSFAIIASS